LSPKVGFTKRLVVYGALDYIMYFNKVTSVTGIVHQFPVY